MGVSRTPAELRMKVASLPAVIVEAERRAVEANARAAKANALAELRRHVPSGRLRNVGTKGAALGVKVTIDKASGRTADIKALGPWQLVEFDTKQVPYGVGSRHAAGTRRSRSKAIVAGTYRVGARKARTKKFEVYGGDDGDVLIGHETFTVGHTRGRRAMIRTPYGWRASAKVQKARKGRHPWRTAYERTLSEAPAAYQKAAAQALRRALKAT